MDRALPFYRDVLGLEVVERLGLGDGTLEPVAFTVDAADTGAR